MIQTEIERRFLLKRAPSKEPINKIYIRQYYDVTENGDVERWRESQDKNGLVYERIIKRSISSGINTEEHFSVDYISFLNKIQQTKKLKSTSKIRHIYEENGLKFEIDVFVGMDLVICEVELKNIDEEIIFPDFIKNLIIKEVTGEKEFSNYNLSE